MSYSLTTADRRTHGKIIAVALAAVAAVIFIGAGASTAARITVPKQTVAQGVVKAAKPTATATRHETVVR